MSQFHSIRLLFVTTDYPPQIGGLQTYSLRIAKALPNGVLRHVLIGRDLGAVELPSPQPGIGISSHRGRTRLRAFAWSLWYIPETLLRYHLNFILHMQWTTAIPSFVLKKLGFPIHYIVLIHGSELLDPKKLGLNLIKALVLENADAVVAGSHHTSEILSQQKIKCKRLEVIHYGNPLQEVAEKKVAIALNENPRGNMGVTSNINVTGNIDVNTPIQATDTPHLVCMHRLVARKGTSLLLEALSQLQEYAWTLSLVGEGEEKENLIAQVNQLGLAARIQFIDPVSETEKIALLKKTTLFILPSLHPQSNNHFEGLGLTLLEAQSMGIPVLAARTGGIPEAVQEGLTGVLFRAGDLEDLRSKLSSLLRSKEKRDRLAEAGPAWVKDHFNWSNSLLRLTKLMQEIVKKN